MRVPIENWRWDGVPIFVRTGKALTRRVTEVVIKLRDAPMLRIAGRRQRGIPTLIVIRIQPDEGISIRIGAKRPGTKYEMVPAGVRLSYARPSTAARPGAYQKVLSQGLARGRSAFSRAPGGRRSWGGLGPPTPAPAGARRP